MSVNRILRSSILILILSVSACKTENGNANQVLIADMKGNEIATVNEQESLKVLLNEWAKREKVFVKMMPNFDAEITIIEEGISSRWKYSTKGYVTSADTGDNVVYRVDLPSIKMTIDKQ